MGREAARACRGGRAPLMGKRGWGRARYPGRYRSLARSLLNGAPLLVRSRAGLAARRARREHERALCEQRLRELHVLVRVAGDAVGRVAQRVVRLGRVGTAHARALLRVDVERAEPRAQAARGVLRGGGKGGGAVGGCGRRGVARCTACAARARASGRARTGGTLLSLRFMNCACSFTYAIVVSSTITP